MNFSEEDLKQIQDKGLTPEMVISQLEIFKRGNVPVDILAAATPGNGIEKLSDGERKELSDYYKSRKKDLKILKFVPASGAATRMFKTLHQFVLNYDPDKKSLQEYLENTDNEPLTKFLNGLEKLPFYKEAVLAAKKKNSHYDELPEDEQKFILVETILNDPGLNLSNFPKGLVPFHKYDDKIVTAFEEHLLEAAEYGHVGQDINIHFTVSREHKDKFEEEFHRIQNNIEAQTNKKFNISYSFQNEKTDTIAANEDNTPFRTSDETLFFRPGGHGALIDNLDQQDADVIFIKNIDNVVVQKNISEVAEYKQVLAGKLLKFQDKCFKYLNLLEEKEAEEAQLKYIENFLKEELLAEFDDKYQDSKFSEKVKHLQYKLNRPLRVCGMVKNEGEPGGGPFLIKSKSGEISLQIIEGAQIDHTNQEQSELAKNATHFNPVDIVCAIKDYHGNKFDLNEFIDPESSFIASKSKDGKKLKALELPGLWNGAMAKWNTLFVEVPVSTFNPVKTVADLLKTSHQPS